MDRVGRLSGLNTKTAELSKQLAYSSGPLSNRTGREGALLLALTAQSWFGWSLTPSIGLAGVSLPSLGLAGVSSSVLLLHST